MSVDTRSNSWSLYAIQAKNWKHQETYFTPHRDYTDYPANTVTHSETEPFITCNNCLVRYNTDSRRINERAECVYVPITKLVTYRRATNAYYCLVDCIDPRVEEEKKKKAAAMLKK
jgi:hypothetical protein